MTDNQDKTLWIIWGAILTSPLGYVAIGVMARSSGNANSGDDTFLSTLLPAFGLVALVETLVGLFWGRIVSAHIDFMSFCVSRWALIASISIYGLVIYMMGGTMTVFAIFVIWSMLLMLVMRPTLEARARYEEGRDRK